MEPIVEAIGLSKAFGEVQALDDLDLIAERGQVLAVLGPNGAGKTTFIRSVATLVRPSSGTLRVAGIDVLDTQHRTCAVTGQTVVQLSSAGSTTPGGDILWSEWALVSRPPGSTAMLSSTTGDTPRRRSAAGTAKVGSPLPTKEALKLFTEKRKPSRLPKASTPSL